MLTLYIPTYAPITDESAVTLTDETGAVLAVRTGGQFVPIPCDDYYFKELANGLDELWLSVNVHDPLYKDINELSEIIDEKGRAWLVRKIDGGAKTATICAGLDLDAWREGMLPAYHSDSLTALHQIEAVAPSGWDVVDVSGVGIRRTLEGDFTPLDVVMRVAEIYKIYPRFDNVRKVITLYPQTAGAPLGVFATRQLNLKEINYKGKAEATDFCTRLYCYGKDGLTFADINGGLPYVENTAYSGRIVSAVWRDDRYTDAESLLEDGRARLAEMSVPTRSYDCDVVDLKAVDPEKYGNLDFSLFSSAVLIDEYKGNAITYQVVERWDYPNYPARNKVIFSDAPASIQNQVVQIRDAMSNPSSVFQQTITAAASANATNWLTSSDGYVVAVRNADGSWKELLFMDTPDMATAQNVLRINENGIGFSTSGANGPYNNAWTIDGQLVADFITTGTMTADRIRGGTLELGGVNNANGVLLMLDANGAEIGRWDMSGISGSRGTIGGWDISPEGFSSKATGEDGAVYEVKINAVRGAYSDFLRITKDGTPVFSLSYADASGIPAISSPAVETLDLYSYKYRTSDSAGNYRGISTTFVTGNSEQGYTTWIVKNGLIVGNR